MVRARTTRTVAIDVLRDLMHRLLVAAGADEENARIATDAFLEADMRGVGLQGFDHMPTMIEGLRTGRIKGDARPRVVKDGPSFALIDGDEGPGQSAGLMAVDVVVEKAKETGSAAVAMTNSADLYMLGYYGERIAHAGCVAIVAHDSVPLVRPYGGIERVLGTNPYVLAAPTGGEHPIVLDFATSALSASRVRHAAYHEEEVPKADGVGLDGAPAVEASAVAKGAIGPLGGHKGFGLAFCVALIAGPLTGSATGKALNAWASDSRGSPIRKGHVFVAIDPSVFGRMDVFRKAVSDYVEEVKATPKASAVEEILMPGERAFRERARSLERGQVVLYDAVWERMSTVARELGVEIPL